MTRGRHSSKATGRPQEFWWAFTMATHPPRLLSCPVMQPGDWINLASAVIAGGSAVGAIVAARRARNAEEAAGRFQARSEQQAERAINAAEQAAIAQRQSSEAAKRSADATPNDDARWREIDNLNREKFARGATWGVGPA